ncbi:MAG: class I SAM-dependent methyltransferase [Solirubrobacteraceae bacterium]
MNAPDQGPHKFDPARAHLLDSTERGVFLPDDTLVGLAELSGAETLLDYGAGTGRVTLAVAAALPKGRVIAVDENPEMLEHLRARTAASANVEVMAVSGNHVALPDAAFDRILAINLLHEIRDEHALVEMRRLLKPGGALLVVDWDRERSSEPGPPAQHRYSMVEAQQELTAAGFLAEPIQSTLPYHFVLRAQPAAPRA